MGGFRRNILSLKPVKCLHFLGDRPEFLGWGFCQVQAAWTRLTERTPVKWLLLVFQSPAPIPIPDSCPAPLPMYLSPVTLWSCSCRGVSWESWRGRQVLRWRCGVFLAVFPESRGWDPNPELQNHLKLIGSQLKAQLHQQFSLVFPILLLSSQSTNDY